MNAIAEPLRPGPVESGNGMPHPAPMTGGCKDQHNSTPARPGGSIAQAVSDAFAIGMFQHRAEIEPFAEWLAARRPHHVIEIGAWHGGTAYLWSQIATGKVISIDLPMGPFGGADAGMDEVACNSRNDMLARLCPNFVGVLGDSRSSQTLERVRSVLDRECVDLCFIDGDHTYEGVKADFERYRAFVAPGGWVAFHDVAETLMHRERGVEVPRLWAELDGEKYVWNCGGPWGAIGAVRMAA